MADREMMIQRAFIAYVADDLKDSDPKVLGLCEDCGFPVYESDGLWHYGKRGYTSAPIMCDRARLFKPLTDKRGT